MPGKDETVCLSVSLFGKSAARHQGEGTSRVVSLGRARRGASVFRALKRLPLLLRSGSGLKGSYGLAPLDVTVASSFSCLPNCLCDGAFLVAQSNMGKRKLARRTRLMTRICCSLLGSCSAAVGRCIARVQDFGKRLLKVQIGCRDHSESPLTY